MKLSTLSSSINPEQVSLTIRGVLLAVIPLLTMVAKLSGYTDISQGEQQAIIDGIADGVVGVLGGISLFITAFGLIRKLFVKKG